MKRALVCGPLLVALAALGRGCATGSDESSSGAGGDGGGSASEASVDPGADAGPASNESDASSGNGNDPKDDASPPGPPPGDGSPGGHVLDDAGGRDATTGPFDPDDATTQPSPDANDGAAAGTDISASGTAYTWQSMTSPSANTGKTAAPAVNDGSLSTQVDIDSSSGDNANAWEAAGVVFPSGRTVASVSFVQGTTGSASSGDGWFEAGFGLEISTDGTTWSATGWSVSPAYSYSSAVSGKTYVFSGGALSGVVGIRVVGQVNTVGKSWWAAVKEVIVLGA
jgi:hypothetical protein